MLLAALSARSARRLSSTEHTHTTEAGHPAHPHARTHIPAHARRALSPSRPRHQRLAHTPPSRRLAAVVSPPADRSAGEWPMCACRAAEAAVGRIAAAPPGDAGHGATEITAVLRGAVGLWPIPQCVDARRVRLVQQPPARWCWPCAARTCTTHAFHPQPSAAPRRRRHPSPSSVRVAPRRARRAPSVAAANAQPARARAERVL
jgi:hypothetical protein